MARLLRFRGFDVSTAFDGPKAIEAVVQKGVFDVVILDVKMPGMDGIATLKEIKGHAPDTEVIMLTGHATVDSGIEAIRGGAFDYLMKPCDIEDVVDKVKEASDVRHVRRQPVLWPRNLLKEITLPSFIKLRPQDPLAKALEVFNREKGITAKEGLYILDESDRLQGIVTKRDLLNAAHQGNPGRSLTWDDLLQNPHCLPKNTLGEIMRRERPLSAAPEENLSRVAHRMIRNNVRCIPIVEDGKVKGAVRLKDILRYIEQEIE